MKLTRIGRMVFFLLVLASVASAALVFSRLRTTNITAAPGQADGIEPGGDRHNSYAWCQDVMNVGGVDYIYCGSNRDLLRLVGLQAGATDAQLQAFFRGDIDTTNTDYRARIFRYRVDGTGVWEPVYTSPTFTSPGTNPIFPAGSQMPYDLGYRGMAVHQGDLYVVSLGTAYSRVLRFPHTGSAPEEVFRVPGGSLRAIATHNGELVIGTEDNRLFSATTPIVQASANLLDPTTFVATTGWTQIAANTDLGNPLPSDNVGVWELESAGDVLAVPLGMDPGRGAAAGRWNLAAAPAHGSGQRLSYPLLKGAPFAGPPF